jgi:hypothetical protein
MKTILDNVPLAPPAKSKVAPKTAPKVREPVPPPVRAPAPAAPRPPSRVGRPRKPGTVPPRAGSRQPVLKLPRTMPDGTVTTRHPLAWAMANRLPGDLTKSDIARRLDIQPQSLYKWEAACRADRNFPIPILRAKQLAEIFQVTPALFRPDAFPPLQTEPGADAPPAAAAAKSPARKPRASSTTKGEAA